MKGRGDVPSLLHLFLKKEEAGHLLYIEQIYSPGQWAISRKMCKPFWVYHSVCICKTWIAPFLQVSACIHSKILSGEFFLDSASSVGRVTETANLFWNILKQNCRVSKTFYFCDRKGWGQDLKSYFLISQCRWTGIL